MEDDKKNKGFNRRDFLTSGLGAVFGAGVYGALQKPKDHSDISRDPSFLGNNPKDMANSFSDLKSHYPVVIIGSGYGGSILACRLAEQGKQICILERGKEWHPGMFPKNSFDLAASSKNDLNPHGLLDANAHMKSDVDVVCASGLGGTSLINAAISSRPEALVWQQKEWPREIREDFEQGIITDFMDRSQEILGGTHHPDALKMKKVVQHKKMVEASGKPFNELVLNVNHSINKGQPNGYGIPQNKCTLCGDCCSGCNVGAKNTLTVNYLPLAKSHGAEIYTHMEVIYVEKLKSGKYLIHYNYHTPVPGLKPLQGVITADVLIMAAGSMGSTQIMMKSQLKGLKLSHTLGSRFSANGDVMGMSYNGKNKTNIIGQGGLVKPGSESGQAIMVYADYRRPYKDPSRVDLMTRFLLLDGSVPSPLAGTVAKAFAGYAMANQNLFNEEQIKKAKLDLFGSFEPSADGALNSSMLFFACGHDSSKGKYKLDDFEDRVHVEWPDVVEELGFQLMNTEMSKYAKVNGGVYIPNPRMTVFGKRMMATHPLGGCPMGEDPQSGVVDHLGRVFQQDGGLHKGFFVVDAATIPRSLGATPLLTISALAERIAEHINSDKSLGI